MPGAGVGKTILVTGGGGYIGSHCVHELLVEDYNVVAVDNFVNSVPGKAPPQYEITTIIISLTYSDKLYLATGKYLP